MTIKRNFSALFNPKSIAIVGASQDRSKLGTVIMNNVIKYGFEGGIFAVNPKYGEILGRECFPNIAKIDKDVDLVVIVIPYQFVLDVVKDCVSKHVKNIIIISAGFKEAGDEGRKLEQEIVKLAHENNIGIIGPNCLGIIVPENNLNASFAAEMSEEGDIAFLSQSGAVNTSILDMAEDENLGFSHFLSIGNKSDINENDLFDHFLKVEQVKHIGAYLEDFVDGRDLVEIINHNEKKPIVVLNPGETNEAKSASASHTGSIASSYEVIKAAMKKAGVIQVTSIEKMYSTLKLLSLAKLPLGDRVGVITNAGGPAVIITDLIINEGLTLSGLSEETTALIKTSLPELTGVHNPLDILGDAPMERYQKALDVFTKSDEIDSIVVILTPQYITEVEETAKVISDYAKVSNKPIIPIFIGGKFIESGLQWFKDNKVASYTSPELAINSLANITNYALRGEKKNSLKLDLHQPQHKAKIAKYLSDKTTALPHDIVKLLSEEFDLDMPKELVVSQIGDALTFAEEVSFPVVLKANTEDIAHKSDLKAIYLNIKNEKDLKEAFEALVKTVEKESGNKTPKLLIQEQIVGKEEIIIGATRDGNADVYSTEGKGFGHLVIFGKGGIYTEIYNDIAKGLVPMKRDEILRMIDETKISKVIKGARGHKGLALEKVVETIEKIQRMVEAYPEIEQMDINPTMLTEDRCICVDLKVFVKK